MTTYKKFLETHNKSKKEQYIYTVCIKLTSKNPPN